MANWITLSRFPLLFLVVFMLYNGNATVRLSSVALLIALILLDSLDGMLARARNETSRLGSVLDIAADRAVEICLWVVFADLDLIPVLVPLTVIVRGVLVDAVRTASMHQNETPFGIMRSRVGRWLVGTPWMRSGYGIAKALAFATLALSLALASRSGGSLEVRNAHTVWIVAQVLTWVAVGFCLLRGIPVLVEAYPRLREERPKKAPSRSTSPQESQPVA